MSNNELQELVQDMRQLRTLEVLRLSSNVIEVLPRNLNFLYTLRVLDLSNNQFKFIHLPHPVADLNLSNNPLVLPDVEPKHSVFAQMARNLDHARWIRSLNLANLQLTSIPSAVEGFKGIVWLDLSHNLIKGITENFGKLRALSYLNISHNKIRALDNLSGLQNLRYLDASHNKIGELPESLPTSLPLLAHLNLEHNRIQTLPPDGFGRLREMTYVNLASNYITELPSQNLGALGSIVTFNLSNNRFAAFPGDALLLHRINELTLSGNSLTELPKEIFRMKNLARLNIADNFVDALPTQLVKAKALQELNITDNKIMSWPPNLQKVTKKTTIIGQTEQNSEKEREPAGTEPPTFDDDLSPPEGQSTHAGSSTSVQLRSAIEAADDVTSVEPTDMGQSVNANVDGSTDD